MDLFWRVQFSVGAVIFSRTGMESIERISRADLNMDASTADSTKRVLRLLGGGIQAAVADQPLHTSE